MAHHARRRGTRTDLAIGQRIREARHRQNLSQGKVADAIGVTFQQVQKYENGSNALPSSRVAQLCEVLEISPNQLFVKL